MSPYGHQISVPTVWHAIKVLKYPAFNPDLLPCVVHIISLLKKALKGHMFPLDDIVVEAVAQGILLRWDVLAEHQ
jgi:hypothetical protein